MSGSTMKFTGNSNSKPIPVTSYCFIKPSNSILPSVHMYVSPSISDISRSSAILIIYSAFIVMSRKPILFSRAVSGTSSATNMLI